MRPSARTTRPPAACTCFSAMTRARYRLGRAMGRVIHFEIHADDPERAQRFYTGVFGWNAQHFGGPMDYRLLTRGPDDEIGINGAVLKRQGAAPEPSAPVNAYVCTIQVD